jgi:hypothetical protein
MRTNYENTPFCTDLEKFLHLHPSSPDITIYKNREQTGNK